MEFSRENSARKGNCLNKDEEAGPCTCHPGRKGLCLLRGEGPNGELWGQVDPQALVTP